MRQPDEARADVTDGRAACGMRAVGGGGSAPVTMPVELQEWHYGHVNGDNNGRFCYVCDCECHWNGLLSGLL